MAWSSPITAVANDPLPASDFNSSVRDNLLETGPGKATAANRIMVSTGANAITEREVKNHFVAAREGTTSTSYTNLATVGPTVTVNTGTQALVIMSSAASNDGNGTQTLISYEITGATTRAADDLWALVYEEDTDVQFSMSRMHMATGLTPGSNTFRMRYRQVVAGGSNHAWARRRELIVIPF